MYNGWEQCFGETLVYEPLLPALRSEFAHANEAEWEPAHLTAAVQGWLVTHERLFERQTGLPLRRAFFVEISETTEGPDAVARVSRVLASPALH